MPRQNQARTIGKERFVSARVALERTEQKMTLKELAARMEHVGCPIQISALQRIEKGPDENGAVERRITVDELVAFAKVFEVDVRDMLRPIEAVRNQRVAELLDAINGAMTRLADAGHEIYDWHCQIRKLAGEDMHAFRRLLKVWDISAMDQETLVRPDNPRTEDIAGALQRCYIDLINIANDQEDRERDPVAAAKPSRFAPRKAGVGRPNPWLFH